LTRWSARGRRHVPVQRRSGLANADTIADFVSGTDQLMLATFFLANIGATGNFSADDARFYAAAGAAQGTTR